MDGTSVTFSDEVKSLGVTLDSALTLSSHVTNIVCSCNYHNQGLLHIRHLIEDNDASAIAKALVLSRLDYCNALFASTTAANLHRLQRVQNFAARVVTRSPRRTPHLQLLTKLHWLPVQQRIEYKISSTVFKARSNNAPVYIVDLISDYVPSRSLRSADTSLLLVKRRRTEFSRRAFTHCAPEIWNRLPVTIRTEPNPLSFHKLLKTYLMNSISCNSQ